MIPLTLLYAIIKNPISELKDIGYGADNLKNLTPHPYNVYLAIDTKKIYYCEEEGIWEEYVEDPVVDASPVMVVLVANSKSAGNLNLIDNNWNASKIQIHRITIVSDSIDFNVEIYEKDSFLEENKIYENLGYNLSMDALIGVLLYEDKDGTNELHIKITNNAGGNPMFNIEVRGIKLI